MFRKVANGLIGNDKKRIADVYCHWRSPFRPNRLPASSKTGIILNIIMNKRKIVN